MTPAMILAVCSAACCIGGLILGRRERRQAREDTAFYKNLWQRAETDLTAATDALREAHARLWVAEDLLVAHRITIPPTPQGPDGQPRT